MPVEPLTSRAPAPRGKRARFWFRLLAETITVALLLVGAIIVVIIVGETQWSRLLKPLPPRVDAVATFDATTGAPINAAFVRKLSHPAALTVSGGHLYVLNNEAGTVDAYDAATGAAIASPFIRGLVNPRGMTVSGNTLYLIIHGG